RAALKKFGGGLAGMALACFGLQTGCRPEAGRAGARRQTYAAIETARPTCLNRILTTAPARRSAPSSAGDDTANNKQSHKRKSMNNQFDELTKSMAQLVTRKNQTKTTNQNKIKPMKKLNL